MEPNEGKPLSGPLFSQSENADNLNGSHDVTLTQSEERPFYPKKEDENVSITEYHLTAKITNSQIGRRELSLLLDVLNYQIVHFGANFPMMLALTELSLRLSGGKNPDTISDPYIRKTVIVSQILVKMLSEFDFSLDFREYVQVDSKVKELLNPYLMKKRTYKSRHSTWRPERLIKIKAVPVSTLYERSSHSRSERYSGYTKGYGESHGNAHRQSTKPSAELDGDANWPDREERNLDLRVTDPLHQIANTLRIKFENLFDREL
jgi:hypothetical protein